jgi:hypothetical protein
MRLYTSAMDLDGAITSMRLYTSAMDLDSAITSMRLYTSVMDLDGANFNEAVHLCNGTRFHL